MSQDECDLYVVLLSFEVQWPRGGCPYGRIWLGEKILLFLVAFVELVSFVAHGEDVFVAVVVGP